MVPPVRTPEHQTALWQGVLEGSVNTVGTDNTSRARATKRPEAGLHGSRPGLPVLGTHLPALLHYGRLRGVPLEILIERATRSPARVYGIYPQKGTIAVGSDADLAVVDLDEEREVRAEDLQGMSDFSPFEGKRLRGWPVATIKAGKIVARDGKIVGHPEGRYLPRKPADAEAGMVQKRMNDATGQILSIFPTSITRFHLAVVLDVSGKIRRRVARPPQRRTRGAVCVSRAPLQCRIFASAAEPRQAAAFPPARARRSSFRRPGP